MIDNADLEVLVLRTGPGAAGGRSRSASGAGDPLQLVVIEDGSAPRHRRGRPPRSGRATSRPSAAAAPDRTFGPRSPDDLYVLYTGGTTGMPKGVMWRQEDIFFAAMGGGGWGAEPIDDRRGAGRAAQHRTMPPGW